MSQDNIEALRRAGAALKGNDPSILDALLDPEVVWEMQSSGTPPDLIGTYRGIDEVRGYFAKWEQAWEHWDWEHDEVSEVGDDIVIARIHIWGRGRHSGIETDRRVWQLLAFRNGKVLRYRDFESREEALEAVGLQSGILRNDVPEERRGGPRRGGGVQPR